eukprot:730936-Rhodomonas_salina.4
MHVGSRHWSSDCGQLVTEARVRHPDKCAVQDGRQRKARARAAYVLNIVGELQPKVRRAPWMHHLDPQDRQRTVLGRVRDTTHCGAQELADEPPMSDDQNLLDVVFF